MDYETASRHYEALVNGYLRDSAPGSAARTASLFTEPVRRAFVAEHAAESTIEGMLWAAWRPVVRAAGASGGVRHRDLVDLLVEIKGHGTLTRRDAVRDLGWARGVR
ncbi:hypothetical protein [Saccharopolyspora gloriosae]|uniref:hypothetical protein n=1 Tax=Saccharopolyspora gloriosae TaxID=455344 RepID=UPI001FB5DC13|nr:hypothetical protein [Saccharopolyspora gloriosae]